MFDNQPSVFENVEPLHRPDFASTASPRDPTMTQPVQAHAAGVAGMGASPDGLGAFARPTNGMGAFATPVSGEIPWLESTDTSPQAALATAGITSLAAAVFFGAGLALGGGWGGMSGVLFSGSLFNIYRAQKWWGSADAGEKHEAVVSALFGVVGVAAGGYAAYKAYEKK